MTRRHRLANALDRALLTGIMLGLAFVMEKALDRMVRPKSAAPQRQGREASKRLVPDLLHLRHNHPHRPPT